MTRAAQRLHLAQPALSQAIAQLERELGVALLVRHARGVEPTDAGRAFYASARESIAAAERAVGEAHAFARDARQRLIIGGLPGLLSCASATIAALAEAHPEIEVRSRELDFSTQLSQMRAGEIDAELQCPPPDQRDAPDLEIVPIGAVPLAVFVATSHPLANRENVRFAEIAEERWPGRHPDVPEYWADCYWLTAQRGHRPRVIDEQPLRADEIWHPVASGRCVTVGPAFFAPHLAALGGVVGLPLLDVPPAMLAVAVRRVDRRAMVRALIDAAHAVNAGGERPGVSADAV